MTILNKASHIRGYFNTIVRQTTPKYCKMLQHKYNVVIVRNNKYGLRKHETYAISTNDVTQVITTHHLHTPKGEYIIKGSAV